MFLRERPAFPKKYSILRDVQLKLPGVQVLVEGIVLGPGMTLGTMVLSFRSRPSGRVCRVKIPAVNIQTVPWQADIDGAGPVPE
jgi:hypothetical protein